MQAGLRLLTAIGSERIRNKRVSSLPGPGLNAIGGSLSTALGCNGLPPIGMVAPGVMGIVATLVSDDEKSACERIDAALV